MAKMEILHSEVVRTIPGTNTPVLKLELGGHSGDDLPTEAEVGGKIAGGSFALCTDNWTVIGWDTEEEDWGDPVSMFG